MVVGSRRAGIEAVVIDRTIAPADQVRIARIRDQAAATVETSAGVEAVRVAEVNLTVIAFRHEGQIRTMLVDAEGSPVPFTPGWELPTPRRER